MSYVGLILILIGCLSILYQDFKERYINIYAITILGIGILFSGIDHFQALLISFINNLVLLALLYLIIFTYIFIRTNKTKVINRYIGMGDVILFFIFSLAFNLHNYMIFIVATCIAGLLYYIFFGVLLKKKIVRIPLAGFFSIVYLIFNSYFIINSLNPYTIISSQ